MSEAVVKDEQIFRDMPVKQAVLKMAVPTVIGQLIVLVYNLADTFFVGRTGNPYMVAGASLILPIFNISNALSGVIGMGGGTLISRLLGANRREEAGKVSAFTFYTAILIGFVWSLLIMMFMDPLLNLLGASSNTYTYAYQYAFCVVVLGSVPTVLQLTCAQMLRATGFSGKAGFGVSMGGILNVILDPLFMFVLLPKGYEIVGAGIATLLSNVITMIYFMVQIHLSKNQSVLSLSIKDAKPEASSIKSIFVTGIPGGISNLLFDISQVMINKLMSAYGDIALAAIGIVLKAERIPLNTGVGICQGMIPILAYNYTARNKERMKETIRFSRMCGLIVAAFSIVLYELAAPQIMQIFINESQTVALGASFLRARCLATPFMFMAFHTLYSFQAMGEGKIALKLAVLRQLILYIPILWIMDRLFGMYGLVWAQLIGDIFTDIVSISWFNKKINEEP